MGLCTLTSIELESYLSLLNKSHILVVVFVLTAKVIPC